MSYNSIDDNYGQPQNALSDQFFKIFMGKRPVFRRRVACKPLEMTIKIRHTIKTHPVADGANLQRIAIAQEPACMGDPHSDQKFEIGFPGAFFEKPAKGIHRQVSHICHIFKADIFAEIFQGVLVNIGQAVPFIRICLDLHHLSQQMMVFCGGNRVENF